jgi:hypothetical protein
VQYIFSFHTIVTTDLRLPSPVQHFRSFRVFLIYFLRCSSFSTARNCAQNSAPYYA